MKHYLSLFTLCLSIIFLSCNDDNSSDSISISKDQLNQSAYEALLSLHKKPGRLK